MPERAPSGGGSNYRERLEAKALVLRLKNLESAAIRAETSSIEAWRKHHIEAYRRVIGVLPADREALRAAAERIAAGGGGTVAAAVDEINNSRVMQTENQSVARRPDGMVGADSQ